MKSGIASLSLLAILSFAGCGPKLIPVAVNGALINEDNDSITLEKGGIRVTASADLIRRTPYNLENYFVSFYLIVRNETGRDIVIGYDDLLLFDERGGQHRAYSPEKMTEIVKSDPEYVVHPYTVTVPLPDLTNYKDPNVPPPYPPGYDSYPYGQPYYDAQFGHWIYPPRSERDRRNIPGEMLMQDIHLSVLPMGRIVNDAEISGNVYFRADFREMKAAKVRVTLEGTVLELPFTVK